MSFRLPFLKSMILALDCPVFAVRWAGESGRSGCAPRHSVSCRLLALLSPRAWSKLTVTAFKCMHMLGRFSDSSPHA